MYLRKRSAIEHRGSKDPWVVVHNYDRDLKIRVDRSSYMGSLIYWHGNQATDVIPFLRQYLKPDMVLVDIGANQGEVAITAAKRLVNGEVFAFEPVPALFAQLQQNIALNAFTNVHAVNCALSDQPGYMKLYTSMDVEIHTGFNEGLASLFPSDYRNAAVAEAKVDLLDNVISSANPRRVDLIKIDVEGAELHALRGATETLRRFRPHILAEVNPEALLAAGDSVEGLIHFLREHGYQIHRLRRDGTVAICGPEEIAECCDIFCSPSGS